MKTIKRILVLSLIALSSLLLVSCSRRGGGNGLENEKVDKSKTQLYVYSYNGGYGVDWLAETKARYEELHAEDSYEPGKKGVQILVTPLHAGMSTQEISLGDYDVYFLEGLYYDELVSADAILDLTDIITTESPYDNKTIESKFTDAQKEYYKNGGKYYAIPHYLGTSGIIYNRELFDKYGWYFVDAARNETLAYNFVGGFDASIRDQLTLSAGPDGVKGTNDDGLPATYNEFYLLCDYIVQCQATPIIWNGYRCYNYTNALVNALAMQNEGGATALQNYTLTGSVSNIVKAGATPGADGKFSPSDLETITLSDSAQSKTAIGKHVGRYYALDFFSQIIKKSDIWTNGNVYNSGYTHIQAQTDFIWSGYDGNKEIAMLSEGNWGINEGKSNFDSMVERYGESASIMNRDFRWMPLPRANEDYIGTENVIVENLRALSLVSSKVASYKQDLAKDFVLFCASDAELVSYTQNTNTIKALQYTMTEEELSKCSPFGRSLYEFVQDPNNTVVYPQSHALTYTLNIASFGETNLYMTKVGGKSHQFPIWAFHNDNISPLDYFHGLQ